MVARKFVLAVAACFVGFAATPASAQLAPTNVGEASELGVHVGGFMLYPSLDVASQYNDNVLAVDTGAKSDVSWDIHPALKMESTWTHYLVAFKAEYDLHRYDTLTQQNTDNYLFGGNTQFDLGSDTQVAADSEYARLSELPGNTNVLTNAAKPTTYFKWDNSADIKHVFDRLQLDIGAAYTTLRFQNTPAIGGGTIFSEDRDRNVTSAFIDTGYQFSPDYQVFLRGTWNERDYQHSVFKFRDSTGYQADVGVRLQLTHLIDGQFYVGYLEQDYKGPLSNVGGFDAGAQLHWSATQLTDVTLKVSRSIEETDEVGAIAFFATVADFGVTHQLTRSVTISAGATYTNNDYRGVSRNEDIYGGNLAVDYHFRPQIHLVADYQYTTRDSNILGAGYSQNLIEAHLRLSL